MPFLISFFDTLFLVNTVIIIVVVFTVKAAGPTDNCRGRSNHLRQDGGLCFEIPPWQHQPVELDQHLNRLKEAWGNVTKVRRQGAPLVLINSELSRYMDTVLAPFLDTYHRNIQASYQQLTGKVLRRIKEEINNAVKKKNEIYKDLMKLAEDLKVPVMCEEERRAARTLASKHVAKLYACTEAARASIAKMGNYAEEMISITRNHMQASLDEATRSLDGDSARANVHKSRANVTSCLKALSRAAVKLGYELDLSLTNARRHNEQSCTKLTNCSNKARQATDDDVAALREHLYECVYA